VRVATQFEVDMRDYTYQRCHDKVEPGHHPHQDFKSSFASLQLFLLKENERDYEDSLDEGSPSNEDEISCEALSEQANGTADHLGAVKDEEGRHERAEVQYLNSLALEIVYKLPSFPKVNAIFICVELFVS